MYALFRPGPDKIQVLLEAARGLPLNTPPDPLRDAPDERWNVDHYETSMGVPAGIPAGQVHRAAAGLMESLDFFPPWMVVARRGDTVIVGARALGLLGIFADRIIAEHDEGSDAEATFDVGFTYATLAGHFETGIESFRAQRKGPGEPVIFAIDAVSRSAALWQRIATRLVARRIQRRFGRDTTASFARILRERLARG